MRITSKKTVQQIVQLTSEVRPNLQALFWPRFILLAK
jgi:hypothetical protein